jgi:hypothetical protein
MSFAYQNYKLIKYDALIVRYIGNTLTRQKHYRFQKHNIVVINIIIHTNQFTESSNKDDLHSIRRSVSIDFTIWCS